MKAYPHKKCEHECSQQHLVGMGVWGIDHIPCREEKEEQSPQGVGSVVREV